MAAVTLPTHYRNVFAELGYAQAEIDATYYFQEKFRSLRRAEKAGS